MVDGSQTVDGVSMADASGPERHFETPTGVFELLRHPHRPRSTLRAWDAADAYVLRHLSSTMAEPSGPVAVINDGFGALACGLHAHRPTVVADSASSEIGAASNVERNDLAPVLVTGEVDALPDRLALVICKVPKSLGRLEDQLHRLAPKLTSDSVLLGAGMARDIHTSTLELFESIIGPTTTSLAEQKARLIHSTFDATIDRPPNPWPKTWRHDGLTIVNRGGVFSAGSLDVGTRFLLANLPASGPPAAEQGRTVVDLGCGNGVVGAAVAAVDPGARLVFVDVSAGAIDSAQRTWAANHGDRRARFHRTDRLVNAVERNAVDLVINNPPFHDERAIGDATAWDMFVDSHAVLVPGGQLRIVANRHLGHHSRLRKIFGNCETVAANRKFVVLSAIRR